MAIEKRERIKIFLQRLEAAPPANNAEEALQLVTDVLNGVEDELTSIPYNPELWMDDGRMYPPQADSARRDVPDVVRYRSVSHNTRIHRNGAIRIERIDGTCLLNKPSQNGHTIDP